MSTASAVRLATPLRIAARGMCCALGFDARAICAAIGAKLNHFKQTHFVGEGGNPVVGAGLYDLDCWGAERLGWMVQSVVAQALRHDDAGEDLLSQSADHAKTAVILLCAEPSRPGMPRAHLVQTLGVLMDQYSFHPSSGVAANGKGGFAYALALASQMLEKHGDDDHSPTQVLLVGADTLLDAPCIEHLISQERLHAEGQTDTLLPGEGAAAVLLSTRPNHQASVWIDSISHAVDPWHWGGEEPLRATALTQVLREAASSAGARVADLEFHASGMTGEDWYAREMSMALSRGMEHKRSAFAHHMLAQYLGETGAAAPVLSLAWLASAMRAPLDSPGHAGLLHCSGDDGQRSACVVRLR